MNNLFHTNAATGILRRLAKLQPNSKPLWGKMNVSQMLAHNKVPLQVALGEVQFKRNLIGILFGGIARKQMVKPEPFKKNLPTAPSFIVKDERHFEKELLELHALIKRFTSSDPKVIAQKRHPFFGSMTEDEWGLLQWKHLDHHLHQFGV